MVGRITCLFVKQQNMTIYLQHSNKLIIPKYNSKKSQNLLFLHCFVEAKMTVKTFKATDKRVTIHPKSALRSSNRDMEATGTNMKQVTLCSLCNILSFQRASVVTSLTYSALQLFYAVFRTEGILTFHPS